MPSAGSSMAITGSGRGSSGSAIVSRIVISGMPASAMIRPGPPRRLAGACRPSFTYSSDTRTFSTVPSRRIHATCWPLRDLALVDPAEGEPADVAVRVEVRHARLERVPVLVGGRGMRSTSRSSSGRRSVPSVPSSALPSRPWRSCRRSGTRSATRRRRGRGTARRPRSPRRRCASGRSTLFTTSTTGSRAEAPCAARSASAAAAPRGVDEQHHAVDHRQPALDLAAEVGVARRVDQVELHLRRSGRRRSWPGS